MWYNALLFLFLLAHLPVVLWDRIRGRGRYPHLLSRLGFLLPTSPRYSVWIHAPSVGEIKSVQHLYAVLRRRHPHLAIVVTTTTATGLATARRLFPGATHALLPLDFSWVMKRLVKRIKPKLFLLVESDFWLNLLSSVKAYGAHTVLLSGKMSERSARRYALVSSLSRRLFRFFDQLLLQSEEQKRRFLPFVSDTARIQVVGSLKLEAYPEKLIPPFFPNGAITIASTHAPEEEELLHALRPLLGKRLLILAPRHPYRIPDVVALLQANAISFAKWSDRRYRGEKVLLVDELGHLATCYAQSAAAIIGGSFSSKIGGHNILEPLLYGCPVLFGPHMQAQPELADLVLNAQSGLKVTLETLLPSLEEILAHPAPFQEAGARQVASLRGVVERSLDAISPYIPLVTQESVFGRD